MASFLYYVHDISPLTDAEFDSVCVRLKAQWSEVNHRHAWLVHQEDLDCGSGYAIRAYPRITRSAAWQWYRDIQKTQQKQ